MMGISVGKINVLSLLAVALAVACHTSNVTCARRNAAVEPDISAAAGLRIILGDDNSRAMQVLSTGEVLLDGVVVATIQGHALMVPGETQAFIDVVGDLLYVRGKIDGRFDGDILSAGPSKYFIDASGNVYQRHGAIANSAHLHVEGNFVGRARYAIELVVFLLILYVSEHPTDSPVFPDTGPEVVGRPIG